MIHTDRKPLIEALRQMGREQGIQLCRDAADCIEEMAGLLKADEPAAALPRPERLGYDYGRGNERSPFHRFVVGQELFVAGDHAYLNSNWGSRARKVAKKHGWRFTCVWAKRGETKGVLITRVS